MKRNCVSTGDKVQTGNIKEEKSGMTHSEASSQDSTKSTDVTKLGSRMVVTRKWHKGE